MIVHRSNQKEKISHQIKLKSVMAWGTFDIGYNVKYLLIFVEEDVNLNVKSL